MDEDEFVVLESTDTGGGDYEPIPDDTMCVATIMRTERTERTFPDSPTPVARLKWRFRIDEPLDYRDRNVFGSTGCKVVNHPSCRIYTWAQAAFGLDKLPVDYRFRQTDLWNRRVRILVATRVGKDKSTGEERIYNYVEDVLPLAPSTSSVGAYVEEDF